MATDMLTTRAGEIVVFLVTTKLNVTKAGLIVLYREGGADAVRQQVIG